MMILHQPSRPLIVTPLLLLVSAVIFSGLAFGSARVGLEQADQTWQPAPGDLVPYGKALPEIAINNTAKAQARYPADEREICLAGFNVSTLDGSFVLPSPPSSRSAPVLFLVYDPLDAASRFMWGSRTSVQSFIRTSPKETNYLFLSYGCTHAL